MNNRDTLKGLNKALKEYYRLYNAGHRSFKSSIDYIESIIEQIENRIINQPELKI